MKLNYDLLLSICLHISLEGRRKGRREVREGDEGVSEIGMINELLAWSWKRSRTCTRTYRLCSSMCTKEYYVNSQMMEKVEKPGIKDLVYMFFVNVWNKFFSEEVKALMVLMKDLYSVYCGFEQICTNSVHVCLSDFECRYLWFEACIWFLY